MQGLNCTFFFLQAGRYQAGTYLPGSYTNSGGNCLIELKLYEVLQLLHLGRSVFNDSFLGKCGLIAIVQFQSSSLLIVRIVSSCSVVL